MLPPGAPMSGLIVRSGASPYELNDEMRPPFGTFGTLVISEVQVTATASGPPAAMRESIATPSVSEMPTTRIATGGSPGGSVGGTTVGLRTPATLLYRITATAPAAWALIAFS